MKLLTPKEIQREKRQELTKEVLLAKKVQKVTERSRKEMNLVKSTFMSEREVLETEHVLYVTGHNAKKNVLINEIATLEGEKAAAMKPVTELLQEAKEEKAVVDKMAQEVSEQRDSQDIRDAQLHTREIYLVDKDCELREIQEDINIAVSDLEDDRNILTAKENTLSRTTEEQTQNFALQNAGLVQMRESIEESERALKREKAAVVERNKKVDIEWVQIKDQRATLARAFKRLKK